MNATTINTHDLLISKLVEKRQLRLYAYFLKFKYQFGSSRLNKGNRANLARITGLSNKNVRSKIKEMILLGWAKWDGEDLVFITLTKLYRKLRLPFKRLQYASRIVIGHADTIRQLITKLASKLVEANLVRQEHVLKVKRGKRYSSITRKGLSDKDNALLSKYASKSFAVSEAFDTTMSCRRFGALLGLSQASGRILKAQMVELGLITVEPTVDLLRDVRFNYNLYLKIKERCGSSNVYYSGGKVWRRGADRITFIV